MFYTVFMTCKIASVSFAPVVAKRNYRGLPYKIPAVPLGVQPHILNVHDLFERTWETVQGTSRRQERRWSVIGEEIARCIVGEWTGSTTASVGMNPLCHPGIWIIRDRLPVTEEVKAMVGGEMLTIEEKMVLDSSTQQMFRDATPDEKQEMWEEDLLAAKMADRAYAEWCWNEGNRIWQAWQRGSKEPVPREMPILYKQAARHYGLEAEWLKEAISSDSRLCPYCDKPCSKSTIVCASCNQPINLEAWAELTARKDAALREANKALRAPVVPPVHSGGSQASV